jgi:tRNA (guanine26-N2/guanine27-N2)-dimethyltransferase
MSLIQEHSIKIAIELPKGKDVNAKMEVFYNPVMISNRNISILLLNSIENTQMNICDPLAGSGIRSLRFIKELNKDKIKTLLINDMKEDFPKTIKQNFQLNKIKLDARNKDNPILISSKDANLCLQEQIGFDYIEVDPFGSPNPFLASAVARISREGIIAVTATDTAALTGTYPKVTRRKYWAEPLRNYLMHEIALRIIIRKIQLQGIQFDKALFPILSYSKDHYYRAYVKNDRRKEACDEIIKQHQYFLFCPKCLNFKTSKFNLEKCDCGQNFNFAGPLWIGKLFEKDLLSSMVKKNPFPEEQKFLETLLEESKSKQIGFYDLHECARFLKQNPPRIEEALTGLKAVRTHFTNTGIKTDKNVKEVIAFIKKNKT